MKATARTRRAFLMVEVIRHGQGVTYRCKQCGYEKEANAYYEADHKEMIRHADSCVGKTKEEPSMAKQVVLQQYGERDTLSEMTYRIKQCVPGGTRLQDNEVKSLAQVALATGLNPFTGEIWYIPGKGPMAGIKGLRRRAREQSTYSVTLRAMRNSEPEEHNIKPGDVGRICELFRHDVLQKAVEINKAAGEMVIPVKPLLGVGIWRKGDQVASSKSATWMADKRAEADALRRGFDLTELQYSDEVNGSQIEFMETAGGWSVAPEEEDPRDTALPVEYPRGRTKLFKTEEAEAVRREVVHNAERRAEAFDASLPMPMASNLDDVIAKYKGDEDEGMLPTWVEEIRAAVEAHPQASDPVGGNGSFVKQLELSASRKVAIEQFRAFVQIVLTHPLADITFGEAATLMNVINADDFEARVVGLLS